MVVLLTIEQMMCGGVVDGRNWSNANASDHWSARAAHSSVVFDNKIWVMGGASVREFNDVWFYWGD